MQFATIVQVIPDDTMAGREELAEDIKTELVALEIGDIKEVTEKAKEGKLALDIQTIGVVVSAASLSIEVIKGIISIVKEIQLRYADKKKIDLDNVPKVTLKVEAEEEGEKPLELRLPTNKASETRFVKKVASRKGKKK